MTENELARIVTDAAFRIHYRLGPGLYESVYEEILAHELAKAQLQVERQKPIGLRWDELSFDAGYRADLVVENKLLLELKSVDTLAPVHKKQVITYLRLADLKLGLLINFGAPLIKNGIIRIVNGLQE